ncbi:MAG TPA: class I SAM-dependent methyltransferase [Candidatus Methylacidiphilales bacterium]|nr:class I SAM-dependent methyltransferase [Candidatus Methylacidiphilales bacterium]
MNSATVSSPANRPDKLADKLRGLDYIKLRLNPPRTEIDYLANADLRDAILLLAKNQRGRALDYGCGGSPYREILPDLRPYIRADIPPGEGLDLTLDADGLLPDEPAAGYDLVLSTQVLEHVPDPARYLAEAYRLLRPGGALILTTHGLIPEHGCPYDFYRWTADGLARAVTCAGFVVEENYKLTLDRRAAIYFLNYTMTCVAPFGSGLGLPGRIVHGLYRRQLIRLANWLGDRFTGERVVPHMPSERLYAHSFYVGLGIRARKPAA